MTRLKVGIGFNMPLETITETIAVFANKGKGKTTFCHRLAEQAHQHAPVCIIDPKGDWWGIRSSADGRHEGLDFVIFGGDHADVPLDSGAGKLLARVIVERRISAVLDLSLLSKTKMRTFTADFAEELYKLNREAMLVIVDEADVVIPQRQSADTARLLGAMEDIAKRGRGKGLGLVIATQRPQEANKVVTDLCETLVLFGITGPRTITSVMQWVDLHSTLEEFNEVKDSLPTMPVGMAWVWSPTFLQTLDRYKMLLPETFDSHKTPKVGERLRPPATRAEIDVDALGTEIAATVAEAKSNDPSELKRQIAKLRTDLQASERARIAADELVQTLKQHECAPALSPEVLEQIDNIGAASNRLAALITDAQVRQPSPVPRPTVVQRRPVGVRMDTERKAAPVRQPQRAADDGPGEPLGKAHTAILTALAQYGPRAKKQVAVLTGYAHGGGGFNNALSWLRTRGYIEGSDPLDITPVGVAALGSYTPLPEGRALLAHWLNHPQLPKAARVALEILAEDWSGLTKEDLARQSGYEPSGGGFNNGLSRLRSLELIETVDGKLYAKEAFAE